MTSCRLVALLAGCGILAAAPALAAGCHDRIALVEARAGDKAEAAGSASSSGQAVAAARGGQAQSGSTASPDVPFQAPGKEDRAARQAAQAGAGGDGVIQAKAALNKAREADGKGDEAACLQAVQEAERLLSAGPAR